MASSTEQSVYDLRRIAGVMDNELRCRQAFSRPYE